VGVNNYANLEVGTTSAALLCIRVYYFNSTATYTLNTTGTLDIEAVEYPPNAEPVVFSGAPNFTTISSPSELTIGGPNETNEGAVIGYALIAKPGASGSYALNFPFAYALGNENCGDYGQIVAGNGNPSYALQGFVGCTAFEITCASGTSCTIDGSKYTVFDGQTFVNGATYFEVTRAANSTQIELG
jgi:hypothetical protein